MGERTFIEWCHHTFNPWWGCTKVSPACEHCYAEAVDLRFPGNANGETHWGPKAPRRMFGDGHWNAPHRWNRVAEKLGVRRRVFCSSMADVFEDRPELEAPRMRLWKLIHETPSLDWLLLSKRPENFAELLPFDRPQNIWLGVTAEDQERADERIPLLLRSLAMVHFLSCEPLLGPIDLSKYFALSTPEQISWIDWVIVGGESGPEARPMHPDWARSIRDQCIDNTVSFFFKQWGEWKPGVARHDDPKLDFVANDGRLLIGDPKLDVQSVVRIGKKTAGRELDGRTWDEVPA